VMRYPRVWLSEFYDEYIARSLERDRVRIQLGRGARQVLGDVDRATGLELLDGERYEFDRIVVAVPWFRADELFTGAMRQRLGFLNDLDHFEPSPITSVHLWFDRALFDGDHLVLPGRLSQWIFRKGSGRHGDSPVARFRVQGSGNAGTMAHGAGNGASRGTHYYQVVISGSRELAAWKREEIVRRVRQEIDEAVSNAREARLIAAKVITEQRSVFSPRPGIESHRPSQQTEVANLFLAGDWTATGWPATMEGAVRSGYMAAEALLRSLDVERKLLAPDLPVARLSRWLLGVK
jgi:uncharacterized protein with NAD-binding domain and iron-sulfur cluster